MTAATNSSIDEAKLQALMLANDHSEAPASVVTRAQIYHGFLTTPVGFVTTGAKPAETATTVEAPARGKPGPKPGAKAAEASTAPASAPEAPVRGKPGPKPGAKAAAKSATPAPAAFKPVHDESEVRAQIRKVCDLGEGTEGKDIAFDILDEFGNGVKSMSDLKPEFFDAVWQACEEKLNPPGDAEPDGEDTPYDPLA